VIDMFEIMVAVVGVVVVAGLFALSQAEQSNYLDYLALRRINRQATRLLKETNR
jgi:hypothetical protein